jgi:3-hydroxyacyl-[acyl-carrier-protein] dehydratase
MTDAIRLDINAILKQLPHRYPFLLVDRVVECEKGKHIRALKNVTYNEPFFPGHFPHRPVMPGVMILEALAQTAGILAFVTAGVMPDENTRLYFVGIDKARFRKPVEPGDQLVLTAKLERSLRGIWKFSTVALVDEVEVCGAEMMVAPESGQKADKSSTPPAGATP